MRADEDWDERVRERMVGADLGLMAQEGSRPFVLPDIRTPENPLRAVDHEAVGVKLNRLEDCPVGRDSTVLVLAVAP